MTGSKDVSRRTLPSGATVVAAGTVLVDGNATAEAVLDPYSPVRPIPVPTQVPVTEGFAPAPGARLWYWDTGGTGTPIILLHAASGSAKSWPYQQPFFARAGYRVIGYSRRGHVNSDAGPADQPGTAAEDLHSLVEFLGIAKFHAVGTALGGGYAMDYALSHSDRLLSLTLACSVTGVQDEDYRELVDRLRPAGFGTLPVWFRELGPAYRAADPDGVTRWLEIVDRAVHTDVDQANANSATWAAVERLTVPTLLLWGDADLYTPLPVQRVLAGHFPRVESVVANECGHNAQWERSDIFNPAVLSFVRRHPEWLSGVS